MNPQYQNRTHPLYATASSNTSTYQTNHDGRVSRGGEGNGGRGADVFLRPDADVLTTTTTTNGGTHYLGIIVIILSAAVAFFLLVGLIISFEKQRARASQAAAHATNESTGPEREEERREERFRNVEKWLVSKTVEPHDDLCDKVLLNSSAVTRATGKDLSNSTAEADNHHGSISSGTADSDVESARDNDSLEDDDSEPHECPICFEPFREGEIVSWSPDPLCTHVFHHHCIKQWLLCNKECPFCREIFLPIDRIQGNLTLKHIHELLLAQQHRTAHCYFCIQHCIVQPPSRNVASRFGKLELHIIQQRSERCPSLSTLEKMRGIAQEEAVDCEVGHCHPVSTPTSNSSVDES